MGMNHLVSTTLAEPYSSGDQKRKKGKGSSICVSHICTLAFPTFVPKQCIPTFCFIMCIYIGGVLFTFLKVNKIMRWKSNFKLQNEIWAPKSFIFVQNSPKLHYLLCKIVFYSVVSCIYSWTSQSLFWFKILMVSYISKFLYKIKEVRTRNINIDQV